MAPPLRNRILEKVTAHGSITDAELTKMLAKDGDELTPPMIEKALLDLEILGLIVVSPLAKGTRRIEVAVNPKEEEDEVDALAHEHDYEASFPGASDQNL